METENQLHMIVTLPELEAEKNISTPLKKNESKSSFLCCTPKKGSLENEENDEYFSKDSKKKETKTKVKFPKSGDPIFCNPEILMTPEDIILNHGYLVEVQDVESEDGYITRLYRIPWGKGETAQTQKNLPGYNHRPVVLFSHGIATSGLSFVLNKEENVLAYQLANKGFDVWLVNHRGTQISNKHTKLLSTTKKYWEFGLDDMIQYDVIAVINHILKVCQQDQLFYVGHSMGCSLLFGAAAIYQNEIAKKIKLMIAYAPGVYIQNATSHMVATASWFMPLSLISFFNHGEFYSEPAVKIMKKFAPWVWIWPLRNVRDATYAWWIGYNMVNGKDDEQIVWPMMPVMAANLPTGFSCRTYDQFLQFYKHGIFQKYDFGRTKNLKKYLQPDPPVYKLEHSTFPVALFYGENDSSVGEKDVERLAKELPNVVLLHKVEDPLFNHFDFITANDVDKLVNNYVVDVIFKHL